MVAAAAGRVDELRAADGRPRVDEHDARVDVRPSSSLEERGPEGGPVAPHVELSREALEDVQSRAAGVRGRRVDPERSLVRVAERVAFERSRRARAVELPAERPWTRDRSRCVPVRARPREHALEVLVVGEPSARARRDRIVGQMPTHRLLGDPERRREPDHVRPCDPARTASVRSKRGSAPPGRRDRPKRLTDLPPRPRRHRASTAGRAESGRCGQRDEPGTVPDKDCCPDTTVVGDRP